MGDSIFIEKQNDKKINMEIVEEIKKIHNENFEKKLDYEFFFDIFSGENYIVYILKEKEIIIGYMILYISYENVDLFEIAISSQFKGRGYSHLFMKELIKYNNILLEVNEKNVIAISLYSQYGFKEIRRRRNYYGLNQDAIIFLKK